MDALLVGSRALKYWFKDARCPNDDYDFFVTVDTLNEFHLNFVHKSEDVIYKEQHPINYRLKIGTNVGFDNNSVPSVQMIMAMSNNCPSISLFGLDCRIASPQILMAIKRSHLHHRKDWGKHISDYVFLQRHAVSLNDDLLQVVHKRQQERDLRGMERKINLNKSNHEFFKQSDKSVRRKFEHDDIHLAVACYDKPLFTRVKNDQTRAALEYHLFCDLSYEDKCNLVREEAYVIGLERIIIPKWYNQKLINSSGLPSRDISHDLIDFAFKYALMRICTDLTKGWFRDFAIDNYHHIILHMHQYYDQFKAAINSGALKLKYA